MGKKTIAMSIRVDEEIKNEFEEVCNLLNYSKAEIFGMFMSLWRRGRIHLEDGQFETDKNEPVYKDRADRNLEKFRTILEENGYPDNIIGDITDNLVISARDMGKFNSKRGNDDRSLYP